jgi:acetolactate synthase I/III small subunit
MSTQNNIEEFTITAFSENAIGLLNKITIIFTRRHVNIESLTVSASAIKGIHKFTVKVNSTEDLVLKIVNQIEKIVEVLKAYYHLDSEIVHQEIALYKVPTEELLKSETLEITIRKHNARILEVMPEYTVIEKTGHKEETQELFDDLSKYGVKQFTRSGRIAVTKLSEELFSNYLREIDDQELEFSTELE